MWEIGKISMNLEGGWRVEVSPVHHAVFEKKTDAENAADLAKAAYASGEWNKADEIRRALGIERGR